MIAPCGRQIRTGRSPGSTRVSGSLWGGPATGKLEVDSISGLGYYRIYRTLSIQPLKLASGSLFRCESTGSPFFTKSLSDPYPTFITVCDSVGCNLCQRVLAQ